MNANIYLTVRKLQFLLFLFFDSIFQRSSCLATLNVIVTKCVAFQIVCRQVAIARLMHKTCELVL